MAGLDPHDYFVNFVEGNFDDWKDKPHLVRTAFNVAVPAFHLADVYYRYYDRHDLTFKSRYESLSAFQAALAERTPAFRTIQGVATAYKHLYPDNPRCEVESGGAVQSIACEDNLIMQGYRVEGASVTEFVQVRLRNGTEVEFGPLISEVVAMWEIIVRRSIQPAL